MRIVAADIGFGYTKITDGERCQILKSLIGEANPAPFEGNLSRMDSGYPRGISIEGEDFFVGELAEEHSLNRVFSLDPDRFIAQIAKPLALCGLVPFCPSGEPVRVVTGLPVKLYKKYRTELESLLSGRHRVEVLTGEHDRREHIIDIERVRVIPQPFGSLFYQMLDNDGERRNETLLDGKYGIIDIGFKTADFAISNHSRYAERGSTSNDFGIGWAYKAMADEIEHMTGLGIELYQMSDAVRRRNLKIRGKVLDISPMVHDAYTNLAKHIADEANSLWARDWDMEAIFLTGGPASALAPFLTETLQNDLKVLEGPDDLRMANAFGYHRFGRYVWNEASSGARETAHGLPAERSAQDNQGHDQRENNRVVSLPREAEQRSEPVSHPNAAADPTVINGQPESAPFRQDASRPDVQATAQRSGVGMDASPQYGNSPHTFLHGGAPNGDLRSEGQQ